MRAGVLSLPLLLGFGYGVINFGALVVAASLTGVMCSGRLVTPGAFDNTGCFQFEAVFSHVSFRFRFFIFW